MARIFCNVENRPFPAADFIDGPGNVTIHCITASEGHTLDGWIATYKRTERDGHWVTEDIKIQSMATIPPIVAINK